MWAAVAAILVSTFFGIRSAFRFLDVKEVTNETGVPYYILDDSDFVYGRSFEKSHSYAYYITDVLEHYIMRFGETGKWKSLTEKDGFTEEQLQSLDINMTGTITYQEEIFPDEKIQLGETITQGDRDNPNVVYVSLSWDGDFSEEDFVESIRGYVFSSSKEDYIAEIEYGDIMYNYDPYEGVEDKLSVMSDMQVWIEITQERYEQMEDLWNMNMSGYETMLRDCIFYGCIILASILVILVTASPKISWKWEAGFDRMWLEVLLFLTGGFATAAAMCLVAYYGVWEEHLNADLGRLSMAGILIFEFLVIYCGISMVRKIKNRYFFRSSLCYKLIRKIWTILKNYWMLLRKQGEEWKIWSNKKASTLTLREKMIRRKRIGILLILAAEFVITFAVTGIFGAIPLGILALILSVLFFQRMFRDYKREVQDLLDLEKVLQQIYEISNGNLNASTDIDEDSLYYKATESLCDIGSGMAKSVEAQLKSERMKVDLITNVSHDLKTPLTSIISYIDLLSKDETLSDEARDYVTILEQKAERLKNIVIDLFDLAKTTSGNAAADFSIMDMKKLVEQTLIEMDDKITQSGFEVITAFDTETAQFQGDVNRMYRVLQNVLDNALKYSLKGSRIYIRVGEEGSMWKLSVTNTAAYRMDFTEEEILERFVRGDQSRTTEGSGLGLSIADSFTRVCGGDFRIRILGDQFTVEILFAKY